MKWLQLVTVSLFAAFSSFADVTRETEWQDVPDTTKVGEVVDLANVNDGAARPLPPYLHAIRFFDSYPEEAKLYYDEVYGNCSSVREGGFHSRNYDWNFDDSCVFVTLMEPNEAVGRHGSVGISGVGTNLTESVVTSGKWSKWYKALPGHTLDGINDAGVAVNINVVSSHGVTNGWHALSSDTNSIHALGAVRWVLDNANSAAFAATSLAARVWVPQKMLVAGYSVHYMISDAGETWVAEEGRARLVSRGERVAMTNFRLFDKMDGRHDPYGTGYERWDLLMAGENITNAWFTKAYEYATEPRRYSEFIAEGVYNITSAWQAAAALWAAKPKEQHRCEKLGDNNWWQTLHTSVYDLTNKTLRVAAQETDDWYVFAIPGGGGGANPEKVKEIIAKTCVGDYPEPENDSILERVTNEDVKITVTNDVLTLWDTTNVIWSSAAAGNAIELLTKTNVWEFSEVNPSSVVGRVANDDVHITVTNNVLTLWDTTNVIWSSSSAGNAVDLLTKTNVTTFADVWPSSLVWRVSNDEVRIAVSNEVLRLSDGTNTVWESMAVTNDLERIVYTWEQFLGGSNVVFAITNYISGTYNLDEAKLKIQELKDIGGGEKAYVTVYNSRDEIILHQTNYNATVVQPGFKAVSNLVAATSNWTDRVKADKDWGKYASDGSLAPSNTVVIRAPNTVFAGGLTWERVSVGSGTVCFLSNKGAPAYTGDPGAFHFRDAISGEFFGFTKNTYTLGLDTNDIQVDASGVVTLTYNITASSYPIVKYMPDLEDYDPDAWEQLNDMTGAPIPGASHVVSWETPDPAPGKKVCYINCSGEPKGFFCAEIGSVDGDCLFETSMVFDPTGGIVAPDAVDPTIKFTIEPYVETGTVKWRIKP